MDPREHMNYQMPGGMHPATTPMTLPPQMYGHYPTDGLPMQPLPPDMAAHMFPDQMMMEDMNEAKKRRIAKACDMCRKKKIKCDGKLPACTQCTNYKTECIFTQVEKKRQLPKGAKYIQGLENRLGRMEHVLRLAGIIEEDEAADLAAIEKKLEEQGFSRQASANASSNPTSPANKATSHEGAGSSPASSMVSQDTSKDLGKDGKSKSVEVLPDGEGVAQLSELMCSLVTNQAGETRYIGSSSGFSIFSPQGVSWINEKTGDDSFQQMISEVSVEDHKWTNWKPEVFGDLFPRPIFRPLPPKEEALSLLKDFFDNFNRMTPLFHEPTFMHLVDLQYSSNPYGGSGWWASLNCALGIAHRLRVMSNLGGPDEDDKAWGYLKNAMGVFSELAMRNTDLLSVQGLLGMALFMQGTPNPQPAFLMVACAVRLAHSIGLHRRGTGFNLNPIEIEQRKRVFWIAYMLDKHMCLRAGRPPAQDDDDMNVDLPDPDPEDGIGSVPLADGKGKMNLFRVMCEFTIIESNVYKRLYSTKATKQTDGELLNAIGELDLQLEEWKDGIPIEFRPEHEIKAAHTPLTLHIVTLHFAYYNCLTTIHRMSIHKGYWTNRLSNYAIEGLNARALNPRIFSSAALCTAAARASISLLRYVPQGDFSCVWMLLYFPVTSLVTLFGNILQNPLDARAKSDTRLMKIVVTFLSMLGQEAEQGGVHRMLGICSEFERVARAVIEKAEGNQGGRRKRKGPEQKIDGDEIQVPPTSPPSTRRDSWGPLQSTTAKPSPQPPQQQHPQTSPSPSSHLPGNPLYHSPNQVAPQHESIYSVSPGIPPANNGGVGSSYSPNGLPADGTPPMGWPQPDYNYPQNGGGGGEYDSYTDNTYPFSDHVQSPPMGGIPGQIFQQPLLPQDLFSLPMTLDWNWAEMSGQAYPTVENGNFDPAAMFQGR